MKSQIQSNITRVIVVHVATVIATLRLVIQIFYSLYLPKMQKSVDRNILFK